MTIFRKLFRRRASGPSVAELTSEPAINLGDVNAALGNALISDLMRERRSQRFWTNLRRYTISGAAVIFFGIYVGFYVTSLGYKVVPNSDVVGVVRVTGPIAENSPTGSANAVIPALAKAFGKTNVKAIVLAIDSPGGKPAEVERIYNYIDAKRKETGKPVVASISNTGASAAYMLAVHTDTIYAGKYSVVGSIGAILSSWDFHKIAERFDVRHRVYASGTLKGMLDPWNAPTPEADAKAQEIVNGMGRIFAKEVTRLRGDKLAKDIDFFTGEVWSGEEAKAIGLVDEVDTLDAMIKTRFKLPYHDFGPTKQSGGFLPLSSFSDLADSIASGIAERLGLLMLSGR